MGFFTTSVTGLKTVVTAIGAGVGVWGVINLLEDMVTIIPVQNHRVSKTQCLLCEKILKEKCTSYVDNMTISCKAKGDTMKIEYTKVGDYYLPNLDYPEEARPIGCWGMLRKEYLKAHKSGTYTYLLLTARLDSYLADLNEQSQEHFELIEAQMRSAEGVTEKLKRQNPMEWVRHCNNIRNRAAEIIKQELIYV